MRVLVLMLITLSSCVKSKSNEFVNNTILDKKDNFTKTSEFNYCEAEYLKAKRLLKLKNDIYKAIQTGDTILYDNAATSILLGPRPEELTYFATIMALKYNCGEAYFHLYKVYDMSHFNLSSKEMTSSMRDYLLYNLSKSFELGVNPNGTFLNGEITKDNIKSSDHYFKNMRF